MREALLFMITESPTFPAPKKRATNSYEAAKITPSEEVYYV